MAKKKKKNPGLVIKTSRTESDIVTLKPQNSCTVEMKSLVEKRNYGAPTHFGRPTVGSFSPTLKGKHPEVVGYMQLK